MRSIEKYFSVRKRIAAGLVAALSLTACETPFFEAPIEVAKEVGNMAYRIATLQWFSGGEEAFGSGCIESPDEKEKFCKLYRRNKIDTNPDIYEEYFGVLNLDLEKREVGFVLGYYDGDLEDMDGKKVLTVVEYKGNKREDFITPSFGKVGYPYIKFVDYFKSVKVKKLDTSENPLKEAMGKGLIDIIKINAFRDKLHKRIGEGLKLLDEELQKETKK